MAYVEPVTLGARGVDLVPLALGHEDGLRAAALDGELWKIRVTSVPEPGQTRKYIEDALAMREAGTRFAFCVQDAASGIVLGCTELSLLIGPGDADVPLFDTTRLHAEAAVARALGAG